tara:strand:+ start:975 stop:1115 length:141 start_codon:yes stop_codon:yes gene_type:complete
MKVIVERFKTPFWGDQNDASNGFGHCALVFILIHVIVDETVEENVF